MKDDSRLNGSYAGDAAWREWFAMCAVSRCSEATAARRLVEFCRETWDIPAAEVRAAASAACPAAYWIDEEDPDLRRVPVGRDFLE